MVTYPFLFGVMFGDIGHGFVLFLFASWLCLAKDSLIKIPWMFYLLKFRYLFLLMGFFATFTGFVYNDMMSLPLNLFGSCYESAMQGKDLIILPNCVYPFGIDPRWYIT